MKREKLLKMVKGELKRSFTQEDFLHHASSTLTELDGVLNIMFEHLRNWYSIYFPELETDDREAYLEIVQTYERDNEKSIEKLSKRARKILPKSKSIGAVNIESTDLNMLREYASKLKGMYTLKDELEKYRDKTAEEIAKNLCYLLGAPLATRLIVEAKGLKRLANMPASSVQVLGAEKALFMHLTKHTKPPKHGIIFLHPLMRGVKKSKRGKVARLLAAKISIAAKADAYTKKFIAPELKKELEKKVAGVRE